MVVDHPGRGAAPRARGREGTGQLLRLPGQAELAHARGLRGPCARRAAPTTCPPRSRPWPRSSGDQAGGRPGAGQSRPEARRAASSRPRRGGRGARLAAARGGDRLGRGQHLGAVRGLDDRRVSPARLALPDRRGDRAGATGGGRGGRRLPRPQVVSLQADGERHVHAAVVVDDGPLRPRRHHGLFNNHSYAILQVELQRVGTEGAGAKAREMLDLTGPDIDFCGLARSMGLTTWRSTTGDGAPARTSPRRWRRRARPWWRRVLKPGRAAGGPPEAPTGTDPARQRDDHLGQGGHGGGHQGRRTRRTASRSRSRPCWEGDQHDDEVDGVDDGEQQRRGAAGAGRGSRAARRASTR